MLRPIYHQIKNKKLKFLYWEKGDIALAVSPFKKAQSSKGIDPCGLSNFSPKPIKKVKFL